MLIAEGAELVHSIRHELCSECKASARGSNSRERCRQSYSEGYREPPGGGETLSVTGDWGFRLRFRRAAQTEWMFIVRCWPCGKEIIAEGGKGLAPHSVREAVSAFICVFPTLIFLGSPFHTLSHFQKYVSLMLVNFG
jgi:hypothetical protein